MAKWAWVKDGVIEDLRDVLPENWRHVSGLHLSADRLEYLRDLGWLPVVRQPVDYDETTHYEQSYQYQLQDTEVWEIPVIDVRVTPNVADQAVTSEQLREERIMFLQNLDQQITAHFSMLLSSTLPLKLWDAMLEIQAQDRSAPITNEMHRLRPLRDRLLTASDFTQLPDIQARMTEDQQQAWRDYRQQLRDLPSQVVMGTVSTLPVPPELILRD